MYGELDGTFPNHPADPMQPANQRDLQPGWLNPVGSISVWPSTATPTACSSSTKPASGLSGLDHHGAARGGDAAPAARRHDPAQPHLLQGRARGGPRTRRHAGAHQGGAQLHQAGHGRDRRRVRWRALGALLLPRQLPGRQRAHRLDDRAEQVGSPASRCRSCAGAVRALRRVERRDQHRGRRPGGAVIERSATALRRRDQDRLDGLTVDCGSWWFNLRPSNTEPLLRLNLEAADRIACDEAVGEVLAQITS
jgi:phosphomannomutase